jgi:glycosyltransferase involved in cell wall biosynthesis
VADLLIVDDHSMDGTVDYLVKRGFHVASKRAAKGLTDSWNFGHRFAVALGYKYIVFANNDILVPMGALDIIKEQLLKNTLVGLFFL